MRPLVRCGHHPDRARREVPSPQTSWVPLPTCLPTELGLPLGATAAVAGPLWQGPGALVGMLGASSAAGAWVGVGGEATAGFLQGSPLQPPCRQAPWGRALCWVQQRVKPVSGEVCAPLHGFTKGVAGSSVSPK